MTWDESKHPRVPAGSSEGGQFTDKKVFVRGGQLVLPGYDEAVASAREAAGLDQTPEAVKRKYREFRDSAKTEEGDDIIYEKCWVVDENGKVLFKRDGGPHKIEIPVKLTPQINGNYFIHNHPPPGDSNLSLPDVVSGLRMNMKELVATVPGGYHRLRIRIPKGEFTKEDLISRVKKVYQEAENEIFAQNKLLVISGQLTSWQAAERHVNYCMDALMADGVIPDYLKYDFVPWSD